MTRRCFVESKRVHDDVTSARRFVSRSEVLPRRVVGQRPPDAPIGGEAAGPRNLDVLDIVVLSTSELEASGVRHEGGECRRLQDPEGVVHVVEDDDNVEPGVLVWSLHW